MTSAHGYPRPQLERAEWFSLNGEWDFVLDCDARWTLPDQVEWNGTIEVPFSPEVPASGVHDTGYFRSCWYRRRFDVPDLAQGRRLLLHFGAVDYAATVWVNGKLAASHEGGYTPFFRDITDFLVPEGLQTVVVRAQDDPSDLSKPRGKQDWQLHPHSIWYPRTTGIWQTVWLERVPATWIGHVRWTPNVERWELGFEARIDGEQRDNLRLNVKLWNGNNLLADDTYAVVAGEVHRRIALSDPGIDDYRNELLWSPSTPTIIHVELKLWGGRGDLVDTAVSYTALRSIAVQGDKFVLNGRPYQLRMVLDQGYWPDGGLTAPDDEAYRRDVELAKAMGFNGVRKHQKVENPRFLYWADHLGLMVWEEMPSAYRFNRQSIERLTREWTDVVARDVSHPCIVAWVPFNESWGVPDLPDSPAQRHYVQALYHLTKTLDPTRPVIGNDGWESVATDIIGIHDYDDQPERIARRYGSTDEVPRLFKRERPGGRLLLLEGQHADQPIMLSEFGGIAYSGDPTNTWGYSRSDSAEEFGKQYMHLLRVVRALPLLAGFCYTQFTDTYQEANGLLYADRRPKFPIENMALATRGPRTQRDRQVEYAWRERLMNFQRYQYLVPFEDYQTTNENR
ncbi:MAG TPA: glycoside hydrolase family 2 TIM barrel-domain containing protein [Bryobacteraceae bacterium]|nr:glycoside hydrolase family 2 TIM barrel-domain containing protein [Bryobacteraceae bacterium]